MKSIKTALRHSKKKETKEGRKGLPTILDRYLIFGKNHDICTPTGTKWNSNVVQNPQLAAFFMSNIAQGIT